MKIRTVEDLGVGYRRSVAERIRDLILDTKDSFTKGQKYVLLVVSLIVMLYVFVGVLRLGTISLTDHQFTPVGFLDWWWIWLFS